MDFILNTKFLVGIVVGLILCHLYMTKMKGRGNA